MNKAELIKALAELLAEKMEIGEEPTNGEVIRALFPNINEYKFNSTWWNAPYKAEKHETCKGCLEPCIMYEPDMRACNKKVREVKNDSRRD